MSRFIYIAIVLFSLAYHSQLVLFCQAAPLGNPNAPRGGTFSTNIGSEPTTLHPITSQDVYSREVQSYILESLLDRNPETYDWEPALATKIETAKNGSAYTIFLRKDAVFSDGKAVTAEDVKFSFDAIFDDAYKAAHLRPYYENIEKAEILDPSTVRFSVKEPYFQNHEIIAGLTILPKHVYGDTKESVKKNKTLLGSGPYILGEYEKGKRIILKRNPLWWGYKDKNRNGEYNFTEISMRFVKEEQVELEMMKTGQLDYIGLSAESYMKKTDDDIWKKNIVKRKILNKSPKGYGFIGWNLKEKIFQDRNVRVALAHLMNRKLMNEKFRYNLSKLASGPWYQDSIYASQKIKPIEFSPEKAAKLLAQAGWADTDKNGVLDKIIDGKKTEFKFSLLNPTKDVEKYFTLYKEDLKKAGIEMDIQLLEWNSFMKLLDEKKFQAVALGWGGGSVDLDPKQVWHSTSSAPGGSNFISYNNPEVDTLIDKARKQLDKKSRIKTLQKVYELIANDAPYAFLFYPDYQFYATQKRIKTPKDTYTYSMGKSYWWISDK